LVTYTALLKIAENRPFFKSTPYRPITIAPLLINMGWWMTLEKLLDVEVPKRAQYLGLMELKLRTTFYL
jgi:NADH-quinone oxidoreductase subunit D